MTFKNNYMTHSTFGDYIGLVLYHINKEYEGSGLYGSLSNDEKYTIRNILFDHYNKDNSPGNTAKTIIDYVRDNREWSPK